MQLSYSKHLTITDLVNNSKFNIDQSRKDKIEINSLITHSHFDHIKNTNQKTFATKETIKLINSNISKNNFEFSNLQTNKTIDLTDNIKLTSLNSGHILGSSMFYLESKNNSLLYTGDLRTKDSILFKGAKPITADILIIESTFGKKEFKFEDCSLTYEKLASQLEEDLENGKLIILGGYSLGKAQELVKFCNKYLKQKPLVYENIFSNCKVYNEFEINLGDFEKMHHNLQDNNILILPPSLINRNLIHSLEQQLNREISCYIATGWKYYKGFNTATISDHCDYYDLMDFVREVKPKKVFTIHGFSKELAKSIKDELKIDARPIEEISSKNILDFF
ncbi:MAG: MBL fold metallo-hydrolase [archaeon]